MTCNISEVAVCSPSALFSLRSIGRPARLDRQWAVTGRCFRRVAAGRRFVPSLAVPAASLSCRLDCLPRTKDRGS